MKRCTIVSFLVVGAAVAASPGEPACAGSTMTFRNNMLPGHLTQHRIIRTTRRTAPRRDRVETLVWEQRGRLVQCNIDEPTPGSVMIYQMMADGPAKVLKLFHDDKPVEPAPAAGLYNLPQPSTRLHSATMTARDAPVQPPLADPVSRVILHMLLDFAHWPVKKIEAGHRWERPLKLDEFEGTQRFEFVDLVRVDGDMTARVRLAVVGKFVGKLEREFAFGGAEALIHWSRPDRALTRLDGQIAYQRVRDGKPDEFDVRVSVRRTDLRLLDEAAQEEVKVQLTAFSEALKEQRGGDVVEVMRRCRDFRAAWPKSLWMPAIAQLERQAAPARSGSLSARELRTLLAQTIVTWEAARQTGETDLAEKTEKAFARLAAENRSKLAGLGRDKDETVRSSAVFALAFSPSPDDAAAVARALSDKSPRVRSMALAGLAARRSDKVSVEALLKLMDDADPGVRRRACQAVAACIPPEHYSIVAVVDRAARLMVHDEADLVRREAIRTIAAIGAPADVGALKDALKRELNQGNRREIERAIEVLQNRE